MEFDARAPLDRAESAMASASADLLREVAVFDRSTQWKTDGARR
jgi:hypothetical protein